MVKYMSAADRPQQERVRKRSLNFVNIRLNEKKMKRNSEERGCLDCRDQEPGDTDYYDGKFEFIESDQRSWN